MKLKSAVNTTILFFLKKKKPSTDYNIDISDVIQTLEAAFA